MCGIAGIYAYRDTAPPVDREELLRIREHMIRRGPDGAGLWISDDRRIGLAHRRLAIIDLSEGGAQPMTTADSRFTITFNGEIYNYRALRKELEGKGFVFRSNSDTEVLLHLYADRGQEMVHALRGMYTFAIHDAVERAVFLARDPFGIKPLYCADDGKTFRFASQVKALLAGGAIDMAPEAAGVVGFLVLGSVPEPFTMYRNIRPLPAGATMLVRASGANASHVFFDIRETLLRAQDAPFDREYPTANFDAAVRDTIRAHLVADVPVGVFLSAGIDSGAITGLAAETGASDLHTLTLGFREYQGTHDDEVPYAEQVAGYYGTTHHTEWISRDDFVHELPAILAAMDQPSIDGVNAYLVSRAASRAGMKVALSGLGGDELLGGYPSFRQVPRVARALSWSRHALWLGKGARVLTQAWLGRIASPKFAGVLEYGGTFGGAYLLRRSLFMPWELDDLLDPATVCAGIDELDLIVRLGATTKGLRAAGARVAALELAWYMRNQLLRDADWAGMAHSVEIRVPLVDAALFHALAPAIARGQAPNKGNFARAPYRSLPAEVARRAKTGFTTPVAEWIGQERGWRGRGLRNWARRVLPFQTRKFRALALVTDAFGGHGGIAKFNRDLLAAVAAMPECGEVVCLPRVISRVVEGVPERVRFVTAAAGGKPRYILAILSALNKGPYDLLIIGHINLSGLGARIAKRFRLASILIVHGIDAWTPHRSRTVRNGLASIDRIVGVSQLTLDRVNKWAKTDVARQRVLPNCVDLEQFAPGPRPRDLMAELELSGKTVLMTFGRLASEERFKGFDEILELMPTLVEEIPNVVYLICGTGPDRKRLEEKSRQLGVADRVKFTGFVEERRKADYYRLADAYVMPSRGEGFGIVFLEALACGIPVLGSRLDGGREALLGGQLGELVDPSQPDDIRAGVIRALHRVRGVPRGLDHYSSEAFRERVSLIVREVLDAKGAVRNLIPRALVSPGMARQFAEPTITASGSDARSSG